MTKKEFKNLVLYEVYDNRKMFVLRRVWKRFCDSSKDAVFLIRKYQYLSHKHSNIRAIFARNKLVRKYGIFISANTTIGKGLVLPHPNGIVFGKCVSIGENCRIFQQVTIGSKNNDDSLKGNQPVIGDNCTLFAGAKIIGNISLSSGTNVGANSVLMQNTEENSVYAGVPARKIK